MLFRNLRSDKLAVPAAMGFVVIGLLLIIVAVTFPRLASLHAHSAQNSLNFVQGLLFGIAIVFEIVGLFALIPALSAARKKGQDGQ